LAVSIVDRTLKVLQCPRMCLQLVGIAAMVLASKLQETEPLSAAEVAHTSGFIFLPDQMNSKNSKKSGGTSLSFLLQIVSMERIVFAKLDYQVVTPTSWWFAYRLLKIANSPAKVYYMVRYLLELALLEHTFVRFRPSVTGAAAFFLANVIFGLDYGLLNSETGYVPHFYAFLLCSVISFRIVLLLIFVLF
uniref:GPI mannosyltransferase 2 n=1 Tax=Gongylonema pulchrum TaxID=637853 RepID=A0A183ESK1_9BILA